MERGINPSKLEREALPATVNRLLLYRKRLCLYQGILCTKLFDPHTCEPCFQIVCPDPSHQDIWRKCHEAAAHTGIEETLAHIRQIFFWPSMEKEVQSFQMGCVVCNLQKDGIEPRAPLKPKEVLYPLEVVAQDFLSLCRPNDLYQNILVMTDMFTRYSWAVATHDQTAKPPSVRFVLI